MGQWRIDSYMPHLPACALDLMIPNGPKVATSCFLRPASLAVRRRPETLQRDCSRTTYREATD
jgi:hypothetical protein